MKNLEKRFYGLERGGAAQKRLKHNVAYENYNKKLKETLKKFKQTASKEAVNIFLEYDELETQIESLEKKEFYILGHKDAAGF
jgi:hypothetical protein